MSLNRQEQETIVEERSEKLFRNHIGQFLLFTVSFVGFSENQKMHSRLEDKCYSLF